jgi:YbbR domain-containing protein
MNLITDDWRLKLLAVGLAALMLGAVAFSQNPPTTNSKTVGLSYQLAPNLVLINPPATTTVTYTGLADVISRVTPSNLTATVDAPTRAGAAVKLKVTAISTILNVSVQNPAPIVVTVDTFVAKDLPVSVIARAAPGWSVTKAVPNPAVVHFTGPASWETNLTATVVFPGTVSVTGPIDSPNQPLQLQNSNGVLDLTVSRTLPVASLDVNAVSIHIEAAAGSTSSTVPLVDAPPSHGPPAGYRITAISISPNTVVITGDPVVLGRIPRIVLPPVDLSRSTSDATFQVAIPYPDGTSGSRPNAAVTYSISANPNVSASP